MLAAEFEKLQPADPADVEAGDNEAEVATAEPEPRELPSPKLSHAALREASTAWVAPACIALTPCTIWDLKSLSADDRFRHVIAPTTDSKAITSVTDTTGMILEPLEASRSRWKQPLLLSGYEENARGP
jgi:hypothetical protein